MVDIPLTLAVLFFQRNLIRLMGQLSARRLQNHEVMDEVTNWLGELKSIANYEDGSSSTASNSFVVV